MRAQSTLWSTLLTAKSQEEFSDSQTTIKTRAWQAPGFRCPSEHGPLTLSPHLSVDHRGSSSGGRAGGSKKRATLVSTSSPRIQQRDK